MKIILRAFALAIAAPVAGQSAPAADPHAGHHAQHQGMDHSQHGQGKHDCKECCETMEGKDGKMECKGKKAEAKPAESSTSYLTASVTNMVARIRWERWPSCE